MALLTLVSCRIFEDEIAHIMKKETENDPSVRIYLAETDGETTLPEKLTAQNIRYELSENGRMPPADASAFSILIRIIPFSMEAQPPKIKKAVYEDVSRYRETADGILVMYGLCGNVLGQIEEDLGTESCPIRILKDDNGTIVDDCICASVGGRDRFLEYAASKGKGTGIYFLTPMQAHHWREIVVKSGLTPDPDDEIMTKMVFEYGGYKYAGKIDTGISATPGWERAAEEFAEKTGLEIADYKGTTDIVMKNYDRIKEIIMKKRP